MTALSPSTTHVKTGLRRLLSKEKDSVVLRAWVKSYLTQVQLLEDTAWLVIESRTLDGEGAQLDALGRFLLIGRAGLSDANFKIALRARIRILRSSGLPEDLIDVARLSLPDGFTFTYDEAYPKTSLIEVTETVDFDVAVLWRNLLATKPGGTRLYLIWNEEDGHYRFAAGDTEEDDATGGDADDDEDGATGGTLSDVYTSEGA